MTSYIQGRLIECGPLFPAWRCGTLAAFSLQDSGHVCCCVGYSVLGSYDFCFRFRLQPSIFKSSVGVFLICFGVVQRHSKYAVYQFVPEPDPELVLLRFSQASLYPGTGWSSFVPWLREVDFEVVLRYELQMVCDVFL